MTRTPAATAAASELKSQQALSICDRGHGRPADAGGGLIADEVGYSVWRA